MNQKPRMDQTSATSHRLRQVCVIALMATILSTLGCSTPVDDSAPETPRPMTREDETYRVVDLYFPGADGRLHAERRQLPVQSVIEVAIADLVHALLTGPRSEGLWAPLTLAPEPTATETADGETEGEAISIGPPTEGVRIEAVYMLADGTVVVDLASSAPPAVGTHQEAACLYSLVNTILLNTPEAARVSLLWNGLQPQTFAGHIDTARPLIADRSLIGEPTT
jgi:hypothetical protein